MRKLIRPKKEKRLPRYITPQQVSDLLSAVSCEKYRLMILMYYGTGMRLSEVRLLRWENINFEDGIIWVTKGKGAKDRVVKSIGQKDAGRGHGLLYQLWCIQCLCNKSCAHEP